MGEKNKAKELGMRSGLEMFPNLEIKTEPALFINSNIWCIFFNNFPFNFEISLNMSFTGEILFQSAAARHVCLSQNPDKSSKEFWSIFSVLTKIRKMTNSVRFLCCIDNGVQGIGARGIRLIGGGV